MEGDARVLIAGGGPVGLALALMLARRRVASEVVDARTLETARVDRRLLALSRGTVELLAPLVHLPSAVTAPIRTVVVSSAGEFGRVVLGEDLGLQPLGVTIRYGDLLTPLAEACTASGQVRITRPCHVSEVSQRPTQVTARLDDGTERQAALLVNAEGTAALPPQVAGQAALVADVSVDGPAAGEAFERFTRDGPLALLPLPGPAPRTGRDLALIWCMPAGEAQRRQQLDDASFAAELQRVFGVRSGTITRVGPRTCYPLHEQSRQTLREHRIVWIGNAAQTLHPVAGQGLNLGMRDAAQLADVIAGALTAGRDPAVALDDYERRRRTDRAAILGLTRRLPGLFATRAMPVAFGRSLGLTALNVFPDLRRQFARLLMFGVRS